MGNKNGTHGVNKPQGCPVRKAPPIGALAMCGGICWAFEECKRISAKQREKEAKKR